MMMYVVAKLFKQSLLFSCEAVANFAFSLLLFLPSPASPLTKKRAKEKILPRTSKENSEGFGSYYILLDSITSLRCLRKPQPRTTKRKE
jgi:hypothetical protein